VDWVVDVLVVVLTSVAIVVGTWAPASHRTSEEEEEEDAVVLTLPTRIALVRIKTGRNLNSVTKEEITRCRALTCLNKMLLKDNLVSVV